VSEILPKAPQHEVTATVRLIGREMENYEVPVSILVSTLSGLQKIVYFLAAVREELAVGQRFSPPKKIQQRYTLRCRVPQPGSYAMPILLKQLDRLASDQSDQSVIMERLESFLASLNGTDINPIQHIFPDANLRFRALREVREFLPKAGDDWQLGFARNARIEIVLTSDAVAHIDSWLELENTVMTVTGELIRIDFDEHTLVLRYPPTARRIKCNYPPELEDKAIKNKRNIIQVTGLCYLDSEGNPTKLTHVTKLEPVDLSPVSFEEIYWGEQRLRFREIMIFRPFMDEESQQLFVVEEPLISLYAFAYTRKELIQEIYEQIVFMWNEYVKSSEANLAPDALRLRRELLNRIEEVNNATPKS
jgi:hypothetical protein